MMNKWMIDSKVGTLLLSDDILDEVQESMRCPRCRTEMQSVGGETGCMGRSAYYVVPPILVLQCLRCGYSERSCVC